MLYLARNSYSLMQDMPRLTVVVLREEALSLRYQEYTKKGTMLDLSC